MVASPLLSGFLSGCLQEQQGRQLRKIHSLWAFQVLVRCVQGNEGGKQERSRMG